MNNNWKKFINIYTGLIIGSIITLIVILFFTVVNLREIEHLVKILSYPFIAGSAIIALFQFQENMKKHKEERLWSKQELAFEKIYAYIKELEDLRLEIDKIVVKNKLILNEDKKVISFTDRKRVKQPLEYKEVHKWVCDNHNISNTTDMCSMTEDGVVVVRNMLAIINIYELIAIGIKKEILDEALVKESLENVIIKNYIFFEKYINHRRKKHSDTTLAEEWELLAKKWSK